MPPTIAPFRLAWRSCLLAGAAAVNLSAAELDWSSLSYTSGSLGATYNNVGGTSVDITFNFPTTGAPLGSNAGSPNPSTGAFINSSPIINSFITSDDSLFISMDYGTQTPRAYVTLDITFSEAVRDVDFSVFDIDAVGGAYQDFVIIQGITSGGTVVAPTTLTDDPAINDTSIGFPGDYTGTIYSNDAANPALQGSSVVGLASNNAIDGGAGNWDFGSQELVGVQLVYTNSVAAATNPTVQWISLGNITFTPVIPEAETYWAGGAILCLIALFEFRRRRHRARLQ